MLLKSRSFGKYECPETMNLWSMGMYENSELATMYISVHTQYFYSDHHKNDYTVPDCLLRSSAPLSASLSMPCNFIGATRCIGPHVTCACKQRDRIIHTGIATKVQKIEDLLHEKVCSEPKHLQTSLCVNHYKQMLYCNEAMYTDKCCCTCLLL